MEEQDVHEWTRRGCHSLRDAGIFNYQIQGWRLDRSFADSIASGFFHADPSSLSKTCY
jgi:hypothetical protein